MRLTTKAGAAAAVFAIMLSGCTSIPPDLGRSDVDAMVAKRGQGASAAVSAEASAELLASLTAAPLTPESAMRIALINNPQLAATYATLGFGAADVYQAGRIRNPVFSASVLNSSLAFEQDQITFGLAASFTDLITLSARKRLSAGAFSALKESIGNEVLRIAAEAEQNYYRYVAAQQLSSLRVRIAEAAGLSAQLAERYHDAGNMKAGDLALERAAASEARLQTLAVQADELEARTALATVLGLSTDDAWQVPAELGLPLAEEDDLGTLLELAHQSRLDLAAASTRTDVLADRLGVVNWTRWLGELDLGVQREREASGGYLTGPTASLELPVFNQHEDALLRANADLQIAVFDVRRITLDVDNSVRLAHASLLNASARVQEYRDVLIPQRVEAVAQAQKEVSFMLIGVFELISLKRVEYDAYQGYLEAIRDYWLQRVALSLAVGNALPNDARMGQTSVDVEALISPAQPAMDHSGHGAMQGHSQDHSGHTMKSSDKPDTEADQEDGGSR